MLYILCSKDVVTNIYSLYAQSAAKEAKENFKFTNINLKKNFTEKFQCILNLCLPNFQYHIAIRQLILLLADWNNFSLIVPNRSHSDRQR
jgi:hypothetical protein